MPPRPHNPDMAQSTEAAALAHQQGQGQGQRAALVFELPPVLLGNRNTFLDWAKPDNQKLYKKSIEKLNMVFKGKSNQIILLYQATQNQSGQLGFEQTIVNILDRDNVNRHLIYAHGLLSYHNIQDWANANIVNQQKRADQDNMMLYQCLYNSVNETFKKKIIPKTEK